MFRLLRKTVVLLLALIGLATVAAGVTYMAGGIGARQAPGRVETALAPRLRALGIPAAARQAPNPVPRTSEAVSDGLEHFADHCAICHGNNGSGDTEMGRAMYPRVPDMRLPATQNLTDGELFYIIENGVRFTGMPGWSHGDPADSWKLVHFIRHQPKLTPAELSRMQKLNPKSADDDPSPPAAPGQPEKPGHTHTHSHKHGG